MTKLVTMKSPPIKDPGVWCNGCPLWHSFGLCCRIGYRHQADKVSAKHIQRPRECIDSAEEVKP